VRAKRFAARLRRAAPDREHSLLGEQVLLHRLGPPPLRLQQHRSPSMAGCGASFNKTMGSPRHRPMYIWPWMMVVALTGASLGTNGFGLTLKVLRRRIATIARLGVENGPKSLLHERSPGAFLTTTIWPRTKLAFVVTRCRSLNWSFRSTVAIRIWDPPAPCPCPPLGFRRLPTIVHCLVPETLSSNATKLAWGIRSSRFMTVGSVSAGTRWTRIGRERLLIRVAVACRLSTRRRGAHGGALRRPAPSIELRARRLRRRRLRRHERRR
jgi:hypothetical protein